MEEVVCDAVAGMGQLFEEKNIKVEVSIASNVPPVVGDVDRIIQVLLNLLSNAVTFCDAAKGRIEIALGEDSGYLRVAVTDNGPGVKPGDREIIFEKFRQAGDTLTDKPHGTGLGLPISRHIIEHHGGRLWVESGWEEKAGCGACFVFTLPLAESRST